jgi:hypothetical protein
VNALNAVLALIQQLLPLVAGNQSAQVASITASIIAALVEFEPLIANELSTVYGAVKGIITSVRGVTSQPDQLATLDVFEAGIDAKWAAVEAKLDPDAKAQDATTKP